MHPRPTGTIQLVLIAAFVVVSTPARPATTPGEIAFDHELAIGDYRSYLGAQDVAIADFDGDGLLDIASVGTVQGGDFAVHLNDADHTFSRVVSGSAGVIGGSLTLLTGDFDEDGHPDLVSGALLLRGIGDGTFAAPETVTTDALHWEDFQVVADLDADGHLDLAMLFETASGSAPVLAVFWGHGDGTFEPRQDVTNSLWLRLAADVTEDGLPDLIGNVVRSGEPGARPDTLVVIPNLGSRAFGPALRAPAAGRYDALATADFNHDGHVDIAAYDRLLHGDGSGAFTTASSSLLGGGFAADDYLVGVAAPDLDRDGWNDIVLRGRDAVVVLRNDAGTGFELAGAYRSYAAGYLRRTVAVADLDGDGLDDVIAYPHSFIGDEYMHEYRGMAVFFGRPHARLAGTEYCEPFGADDPRNRGDATAIHLRSDGIADLIRSGTADSLYLLPNRGDSGFGSPTTLGPGSMVTVVDLDHDGLDDLVSQMGTSIEVRLGQDTRTLSVANPVGTGKVLAAGDLDGGQGVDLVVRDGPGDLALLTGDGLGGFLPPLPLGVTASFSDAATCRAAVGDLDGDGLGDLVLAKWDEHLGDSLCVFHSNERGPVQIVQRLGFPSGGESANWCPIGGLDLADLDNDGDQDLLILHSNDYSVTNGIHVLLNDGTGRFSRLASYPVGPDIWSGMVVGDLDGDGIVDVVTGSLWGGTFAFLTVFRGNGDGTFAVSRRDAGAAWPHFGGLAIGRFDADDRLDVAVPTARPYGMLVLHNISEPGVVTPVLASLVSASIDAGVARITWSTDAAPATEAIVLRSLDGAAWSERARLHPDGDGRVRFEDAALAPGQRVGYRLAFSERGALVTASETWLAVPVAARLALAGARPNPVAGDLMVAFSLAHRTPGTLALFDLAGRRIAEQDVSALDVGEHRIRLAEAGAVRPGLYFILLVTPERTLTARAIVMN